MPRSAVIVVDMLYDFIDGSMACRNAHSAVIEAKKHIQEMLRNEPELPILFILDHHPKNHSSFKEEGGQWPSHCVAGTHGGDIHEDLKKFVKQECCFFKGCEPVVEQYSGWQAKTSVGESLDQRLKALGVENTIVMGIATEYCVRATCLDLLSAGFKVKLCQRALAYVDEQAHRQTIDELKSALVVID